MHTHLSGVAFHVHCVGLGCHVVIGVGRLVVRFHHDYATPSFLLGVVVRLYFVIVNSNCGHNYCLLHIAKTSHSRCCLYRALERRYPPSHGATQCVSGYTTRSPCVNWPARACPCMTNFQLNNLTRVTLQNILHSFP